MKTPQIIKFIFKRFKKTGELIQLIINCILLSIVYLLGVGITSIIAKIMGKKFLNIKKTKDSITYWSDLNLKQKDLKEHYKQF